MSANTGYKIGSPSTDLATAYVTKNYVMDLYPLLSEKYKNPQLYYWGHESTLSTPPYLQIGSNTSSTYVNSDLKWEQMDVNGIFTNLYGYDSWTYYAGAIKTDGTLWTWGAGSTTLGTPETGLADRHTPYQVGNNINWKQVAVGSESAGITNGMAAIKTDGTLWGWGATFIFWTTTGRSSPTQELGNGTDWKQVSFGGGQVLAIKANNTLWGYGQSLYGELGTNTWTPGAPAGTVGYQTSSFVQIGANTNWKQVSCGTQHTAAVKFDGTLWIWGRNQCGQLGQDLTWPPAVANTSSPAQTIIGGNDWKQVSCGYHNTAAIKEDGTLWIWGSNRYGQIGNNRQSITLGDGGVGDNVPYPQMISTSKNWRQVVSGWHLTTALKTDGTLWTWGFNELGSLGDSTNTSKSSPVQIYGGGNNWKFIAGKHVTSMALKDESGEFNEYDL